jgi:hypothetical protein
MTLAPRPDADPERNAATAEGIRRGPDRRAEPTPRFSRYSLLGGQRRKIRRASEREGSFVDLYDPPLLALILWVAGLNALDSFYTLHHLQAGGIELNPVAAWMLERGRLGFVLWKSALIALALVVLCIHKNFTLARAGLALSATIYTLLVGYHLFLLGRH